MTTKAEAENNKKQKLTGIDILDKLSPEERKEVKIKSQMYWDSLTRDQKVEHMNLLYDMIRQKMIEHRGLYSKEDCIREYLNRDFPQVQEAAAQEMENAGYVGVARSIRQTRWGVDKFAIEIIDDENRERGVILED